MAIEAHGNTRESAPQIPSSEVASRASEIADLNDTLSGAIDYHAWEDFKEQVDDASHDQEVHALISEKRTELTRYKAEAMRLDLGDVVPTIDSRLEELDQIEKERSSEA
jgi:hypothetical protein